MLHSFSVFEIQKMRNKLKASKSYPNDLLLSPSEKDEVAEDSSTAAGRTATANAKDTKSQSRVTEEPVKDTMTTTTTSTTSKTPPVTTANITGTLKRNGGSVASSQEPSRKPEENCINVSW